MSWAEVKKINSDLSESLDKKLEKNISPYGVGIPTILTSAVSFTEYSSMSKTGTLLDITNKKGLLYEAYFYVFTQVYGGNTAYTTDILSIKIDNIEYKINCKFQNTNSGTWGNGVVLFGICDYEITDGGYIAYKKYLDSNGRFNSVYDVLGNVSGYTRELKPGVTTDTWQVTSSTFYSIYLHKPAQPIYFSKGVTITYDISGVSQSMQGNYSMVAKYILL